MPVKNLLKGDKDTQGRVIVTAEYTTPAGATSGGRLIAHHQSTGGTGMSMVLFNPKNISVMAYSFSPDNPEETISVLPKVKRSQAGKPKKVLYPGNRMCEIISYKKDIINMVSRYCQRDNLRDDFVLTYNITCVILTQKKVMKTCIKYI